VKPPRNAALRPKLGIGVLIGAAIVFASTASGNDSLLGMALGGGAGIALGLTMGGLPGRLGAESVEERGEDDR
jgi:uncharacterized membrane protein YjfL (UPF0719 family)